MFGMCLNKRCVNALRAPPRRLWRCSNYVKHHYCAFLVLIRSKTRLRAKRAKVLILSKTRLRAKRARKCLYYLKRDCAMFFSNLCVPKTGLSDFSNLCVPKTASQPCAYIYFLCTSFEKIAYPIRWYIYIYTRGKSKPRAFGAGGICHVPHELLFSHGVDIENKNRHKNV